jgi:SOS response regulatory protein OraA/RecX
MKINKIKKLSTNKYELVFETGEKLKTYDEVILKYNLLYKKDIDKDTYQELMRANDYYSIYNNSIKYLTKKMHSKKDFFKFIDKYEMSNSDKTRMVKELESLKLIDDDAYLKAYINDRFYLSSDAPNKIKDSLIKEGIKEEKINIELSKIDEEELNSKIAKIVSKKLKTSKGSNYQIREKILLDMRNLGYNKEDVEPFIENVDESSSLEKDYNKIYNSLKNKEKDLNKLEYKIKSKLYQKGYNLTSIDEIIAKKRID